MIVSLICALALAPPAREFFPLVPGNVWHYDDGGKPRSMQSKDTVGQPTDIGGRKAIPVISTLAGVEAEVIYYIDEGDTISIVAYQKGKPLEVPMPVLKVTDKTEKWDYVGETYFAGGKVPLRMKAESKKGRNRKVLGKDVETWESSYDATLGDGVTATTVKQRAVYARGIGLVEMTNEGRIGRNVHKRTLTLVRFEPGQPETP
jgi:hypothetical protein